jgi:hypothetical protein
MAVQSATSRIQYAGNNSTTTSYAVPFVFLENSHLQAIARTSAGVESTVTLTNHTGAGDVNGGTVQTAVAVPATSTLTIYREVPATQTTQYAEGGDFPAASHERALDKLTFIAQQNERIAERAIRVNEADGARNEMTAVANSIVGLDANRQPKAMTLSEVKTYLALSGVTIDVNAGMKTFADAGERALAVPDFTGQLGTQRDTADIYIATGTSAGDWSLVDENMSLADFAAGFFTADASGRGKFASEFVDSGLLADDAVTTAKIDDDAVTTAKIDDDAVTTAKIDDDAVTTAKIDDDAVTTAKIDDDAVTTAKIDDGAVTTAKIDDGAVTPEKLERPYTLDTAQPSTSGVSVDFGIPSWAKRITVMFHNVSTSGTSGVVVRVGSGSFLTAGYAAGGTDFTGTATVTAAETSGLPLSEPPDLIGDIHSGVATIVTLGANVWAMSSIVRCGGNRMGMGAASIEVGGTLDRVQVATINGSDTFDGGTINVSYE